MTMRSLAVTAAIFLIFSVAHASSDEGLAFAIVTCSAQPDDKAQLACYNQIAAQLKAGAPLATQSPPPTTAPAAAPPQVDAQVPAARAVKQEGSSWYNVGSWFGSSDALRSTRPMVGDPADFGKGNMPFQADAPEPLDHITAGVANVTYNFFRRFTVTLDNGQVWRQEDSDSDVARFEKDKLEIVTISRGLLDSYHLTIQDRWGTFKVRRIK
jgi:hypothetical protein